VLLQKSPTKNIPVRCRTGKSGSSVRISDGRYVAKMAESPAEVDSALRLRHNVFRLELGGRSPSDSGSLEFDSYDFKCRHLIIIDRTTAETVGTYRLNSLEGVEGVRGFYSHNEFSIEDLPEGVLRSGVEIGRACIAAEHRNTKVLFLLWKGLAAYLKAEGKRYFFGCCSIFTRDASVGAQAHRQLLAAGHLHPDFQVAPRTNAVNLSLTNPFPVELPNLFNMYLRIGAKVCGPPMIDPEFGTIDFFVVCDTHLIGQKYRRMFFDRE
jgi:putative hemolysin